MIVDPITEDEVFARLRATLLQQGLVLQRGTLDGKSGDERGRFYTTRGDSAEVVDRRIDLDRWARQHAVLKPNEALVPSPDPGV